LRRYTKATRTASEFLIQLGVNGWGVFIAAGGTDSGACDAQTANTIGYFHTAGTDG